MFYFFLARTPHVTQDLLQQKIFDVGANAFYTDTDGNLTTRKKRNYLSSYQYIQHTPSKMKSVAILTALAGSAAAFAPASTGKASTAIMASVFDNYVGAVDFRGAEMKFDPLKLSETYEPFQGWFRECELRHGRTAMLAVTGFIATDFVRIPGEMYSFAAIPNTIDAHDALLKTGPMYQLALWIGLFDILVTAPACQAMGEGEREAGGKFESL